MPGTHTAGAETAPTPGWASFGTPVGQGSDGDELTSVLKCSGARSSECPTHGDCGLSLPGNDMMNGLITAAFTA